MLFIIMMLSNDDDDKAAKLFEAFNNPLLNYAYFMLRDRDKSEDAVSETFLRALKNLHKINENERSKTRHYLVTILRNVVFSMLKKENASAFQDMGEGGMELIMDDSEPVWSLYQAKELYQDFVNYIRNNLSETDRQVLILRFIHKMSYKDISNIVGISESNVSAKLSRIRTKMKSDLKYEEASK